MHLSEKIEHIKKTYLDKEIVNSFLLRTFVFIFLIVYEKIFELHVDPNNIKVAYIFVLLLLYLLFKRFRKINYTLFSYLFIVTDIFLITSLNYPIHFYFLIPALSFLNNSYYHVLFSVIVLLMFSINGNKFELETITDLIVIIGIGGILFFKNLYISSSIYQVKNLIIEKIITKAHFKLLAKDGNHRFENWELDIIHIPSEMLGADFLAFKKSEKNKEDIMIIIGDVTSHGLDVSPVAFSCLSLFHGLYTDDVTLILNDINRIVKKLGSKLGGTTLCMLLKLKPDGTIIYNGSLNTPVSLVKESDIVEINSEGYILGKSNSVFKFKEKKIKLKLGERLCLTTDGFDDESQEDDMTQLIISYIGNHTN